MKKPRLGRVGYINCLPIFYALENHFVKIPARIVADYPSRLNSLLASGKIEVTAVSSITYAHHQESCVVLPELSIASDGAVWSVALLSRVPLSQLNGRRVSLTPYSATSVALLQIILRKFYGIKAQFFSRPPGASPWWGEPDASLVIGDEALKFTCPLRTETHLAPASQKQNHDYYIYDLGAEWKAFTGRKMVYALWVARREFALQFPSLLQEILVALLTSKQWGYEHWETVADAASRSIDIQAVTLAEYFQHLKYELSASYVDGLQYFFESAWQCGMLRTPVQVEIWGEVGADKLSSAYY